MDYFIKKNVVVAEFLRGKQPLAFVSLPGLTFKLESVTEKMSAYNYSPKNILKRHELHCDKTVYTRVSLTFVEFMIPS